MIFGSIRTIAYMVGIPFSVITLGLAAGASSVLYEYDYIGYGYAGYQTFNFVIYRSLIAFGVLCFLYFTFSTVMHFVSKDNAINSVMVDTIALGILFIIGLAASSWCVAAGGAFNGLGAATAAFGWLLTLFVLALLLFVVIYTLKRHGGSMEVWCKPLYTLDSSNATRGGSHVESKAADAGVTNALLPTPQQPLATQQPIQAQGNPQGYIQPSTTGTTTTNAVSANNTGASYPPQQATPAYYPPQQSAAAPNSSQPNQQHHFQQANAATYTVNLGQPGPAHSEMRYPLHGVGEVPTKR